MDGDKFDYSEVMHTALGNYDDDQTKTAAEIAAVAIGAALEKIAANQERIAVALEAIQGCLEAIQHSVGRMQ